MSQVRILIIDDEINIAKTIAATFAKTDFLVEICHDGTEGLKRLQTETWDVVFLDIRLPGMDGMEILKQIYDNKLQVNVVMVTAYGSIENAVQAMKYGAVDFVPKPLEPQVLREIVRKIISRHLLSEQNVVEYQEIIELTKRHIKEREYHKAHADIKQAITQKPESSEAYNLLGAINEVLGDNIAASQAYQMAIKFDAHYLPALENLKRITSMEANSSSLMDLMASLNKETKL
jgi:DNA-binding NtrC family response regulator